MNELMKVENQISTIEENQKAANLMFKSGLFIDTKSEAQAFVKIQAGAELGLQPFQSMNSFDIITGRLGLKPIAMAAFIKKSGKYSYKIIETTEKLCSIEFYENNSLVGTETFTVEDAQKQKLLEHDGWKKSTKNMCFWRCMSFGARHYCPDIFFGAIYTTDELNDFETEPTKTEIKRDITDFKEAQETDFEVIQTENEQDKIDYNDWAIMFSMCESLEHLEMTAQNLKKDETVSKETKKKLIANYKDKKAALCETPILI